MIAIPNPSSDAAQVTARVYGHLPDGRPVEAWLLRNSSGMELEVITLGGIVTRLLLPTAEGSPVDVVLGFDDLDAYLQPHPWFGATAGRVAGRITKGQLSIGETDYQLPINDPPNHLHGGPQALDKLLWKAQGNHHRDGSVSVEMSAYSPDGDQGYPGHVDLRVIYTLTEDNRFLYETEAISDRPTPISLTHHSYFNLAGSDPEGVRNHTIQVWSDETIPTDDDFTLLDDRKPVHGTARDLRKAQRVEDYLSQIFQNHGDLYWLGSSDELRHVAALSDPNSGRRIDVHTTHSCLQLYGGALFDGSIIGKGQRPCLPYAGFCLECQGYPNACQVQGFGDILVYPGHPQRHSTIYAFSYPTA